MRTLISLMLVTSIVGAQEVRAPQRGEERREPTRVERPEPVRVQPEPRHEQPPRREEPRPEPQRPQPPLVRTVNPPIFLDPWNNPWNRMRFQCWDRWDCRNVDIQLEFNRMERPRRPRHTEMTLLRERWEELTPRQRERLLEARKDFREKVQKILNNP